MTATAKKIWKGWILPFGVEILIMLLLLKFVFFLTVVPTGSMIPAIGEGSWLFVTHVYQPEKTVGRGDILVFDNDELGETLIKRVVGLPGDEIELDGDGKMILNGSPYPEEYVVNGSDGSGTWRVPPGCYLFMGDNRSNSFDARGWDNPYIPADKIIGKAHFALWPLSNFGPLE